MEDNHSDFARSESAALAPTSFELFHDRCLKLCAEHLEKGHDGKPTFDRDGRDGGYSLDWLVEQHEAGKRPLDVMHSVLWFKNNLHKNPPFVRTK